MSQTGTPTEFLQLGITEPDDTLNVLVDLNGQWQKIDTGVKNVDTKANTNASGISALNTAVQDNTENITNILETNVNQQTSIDTLQSKVATLEEDDTSYGSRITAVEAGVQENSELINDLEVDLSGVKTSVGTVPSGSNLQGEVDGLDTRVTALENSGSVAAVEARVTTLETEVGTVNGQVNSGNIPFRFSVDGGGNYGYLKADDSFVPFSSGDARWHKVEDHKYSSYNTNSFILIYADYHKHDSPYYGKLHDLIHGVDYTLPHNYTPKPVGSLLILEQRECYILINGVLTPINDTVVGVIYDNALRLTYYLTRSTNTFQYKIVDVDGNDVGLPVSFTLHGNATSPIIFTKNKVLYKHNGVIYKVHLDTNTGTATEDTSSTSIGIDSTNYISSNNYLTEVYYTLNTDTDTNYAYTNNVVYFNVVNNGHFTTHIGSDNYYYI